MDFPVLAGDSSRTDAGTLLAAQGAGRLPALPDGVLDADTEIQLLACAVGLDTALLHTLSRVLGGADKNCPRVVSTRLFNQYEPENGEMQQRLAEFWYTTYPTYQRPAPDRLAEALAEKYPEQDIAWADALSRRRPRWAGDAYWRPIVVPVHWAVTYPDSSARPALNTPEDQQRWLAAQPELLAAIARLGLPADRFRWTFRLETLTFGDGTREPAMVAEGQTTVCCVLRAVNTRTHDFNITGQFKHSTCTESFFSFLGFCH